MNRSRWPTSVVLQGYGHESRPHTPSPERRKEVVADVNLDAGRARVPEICERSKRTRGGSGSPSFVAPDKTAAGMSTALLVLPRRTPPMTTRSPRDPHAIPTLRYSTVQRSAAPPTAIPY